MASPYRLKRIQIEVVNLCNFRCPLCPTIIKDHVVRTRMKLSEFKKILDPVLADIEELTFFGTKGEPLLNNELAAMISYAKKMSPEIYTSISTNASLLTKERALELMQAGLDKIILGVDGLSQESLADYRVGANFETIIQNIRATCEIKKSHQFETQIQWQFIPMKKNESEIPRLEKFAFDLGVDVVSLKLSRSVSESDYYQTNSPQFIPKVINQETFTCPSGTDKFYLDPNGDVFACCFMEGRPEFVVGNALQTPLRELWENKYMQELRQSFEEQRPWSFCEKECRGVCQKEKFNVKAKKYPKRSLRDDFDLG